jgi:hypothetical protein
MPDVDYCNIYQEPDPAFQERIVQGDILKPEAINWPGDPVWGWMVANAICDLMQDKRVDYLRFVPVNSLKSWLTPKNSKERKAYLERITKYTYAGLFFLPPIANLGDGSPAYADLGYVISLPVGPNFPETSKKYSAHRLTCIKPPWRERFAEAISETFFRIGVADQPAGHEGWRERLIAEVPPKPV